MFTTNTVTHTFQSADGSPATGRVQFTLTKGMTNGDTTIIPVSLLSELDDGVLSQALTSNLDVDTDPSDTRWRVDLRIDGAEPQTYFCQVPVGETVDLGALLPSAGTTVPYDSTPQWESYLDMEIDVKPYLQIGPGNTQYDTALTDITAMACTWVQNYLSRPIAPTVISEKRNGWEGWEGAYILTKYNPILQVINITEWWGNSGPHVLSEQTPEHQANTSGGGMSDVYQLSRGKGLITRTFPGLIARPWFPGVGNIEITYLAGFNPIPRDIIMGTKELINYWYRNTQEVPRSLKQSAYEEPGQGDLWPGIPHRVVAMLENYVQQNMG